MVGNDNVQWTLHHLGNHNKDDRTENYKVSKQLSPVKKIQRNIQIIFLSLKVQGVHNNFVMHKGCK